MSSHSSTTLRILGQAWPILFGQFAAMAFGVVDTMMTGHSSATDLAAMGLGASIYGSVFVSLLGVVNALNPIIAHHHGAGSEAAIGASYVQGVWLALLVSAVGCPVLVLPELWLSYLDVPFDVRIVVTRYLRVLGLALPAALMFRAVYALNVAVSRPKVVMSLQIFGLVVKVVLSGLLIFGHLGLPRLGAVGLRGGLGDRVLGDVPHRVGSRPIRRLVQAFRDPLRVATMVGIEGPASPRCSDGAVLRARVDVVHVHGAADRAAGNDRDGRAPDRHEPRRLELSDPARARGRDRDGDGAGDRRRGSAARAHDGVHGPAHRPDRRRRPPSRSGRSATGSSRSTRATPPSPAWRCRSSAT